jgi:hypothetical protein
MKIQYDDKRLHLSIETADDPGSCMEAMSSAIRFMDAARQLGHVVGGISECKLKPSANGYSYTVTCADGRVWEQSLEKTGATLSTKGVWTMTELDALLDLAGIVTAGHSISNWEKAVVQWQP